MNPIHLQTHSALRRSDAAAFRPAGWLCAAAAVALLLASANAAEYPFSFSHVGDEYRLTLDQNSAVYFGLQHTGDLAQPFGTIKMALGTPGPIFGYTPAVGETQGFFRLEGISVYAPADSDFDGMDDIWELEHPGYLDPLNSADAFAISPEPGAGGITNLQFYRLRFGLGNAKPQYYSRELSLFNFGAHISTLSREISLFNFGRLFKVEALSREVSVFNGDMPPIAGYPQVYSREVSLFNFGAPVYAVEALSREVSVFNGDMPPIEGYPQVYSRELSVFNFGAPVYAVEAVSREISVFNNIPQ